MQLFFLWVSNRLNMWMHAHWFTFSNNFHDCHSCVEEEPLKASQLNYNSLHDKFCYVSMIVHLQIALVQKLMNSLALGSDLQGYTCTIGAYIKTKHQRGVISYKYFLPFKFPSSSHPVSKINNKQRNTSELLLQSKPSITLSQTYSVWLW